MDASSPSPPLSYELVNVYELPSIDVRRSVKSVLLSERGLRRLNKFLRRTNRFFFTLLLMSLPLDLAIFFVRASLGRQFAIVKVVFQVPMLVAGMTTLRVDMLKLLLKTYEFWFMSTLNLATCIVFFGYFGDIRALSMVVYTVGLHMNICIDANLQTLQLSVTSCSYILYQLVVLITVVLQLTPSTHITQLLTFKSRTITSQDFLLHSLTTIMVLMIRNAYRKRQFMKRQSIKSAIVRCVTYKCRVKLQLRDLRSPSRSVYASMTNEIRAAAATISQQQLRFVGRGIAFYEDDVVCNWVYNRLCDPSERVLWWRAAVLYGLGICSLVVNMFSFLIHKYPFQGSHFHIFSALALACTLSFLAVFVSCYNRSLLRELVFSFDFCFLSFQLSVVHVCACDVFFWDGRCYFVLFNWLAMHWVLTIDALVPKIRQSLGLSVRFVIPVVGFFILAITRITLDMVVLTPTRPFQNRLLWGVRVLGCNVEFRTEPFLLSRVWMLLLWCIRVLWRLCTSDDDDCIILQGTVEFVASRLALGMHEPLQQRIVSITSRAERHQPPKMSLITNTNQVVPLSSRT